MKPSELLLKEQVEQQDTQPVPVVRLVSAGGGGLLTLRQVRERCGLNQIQLAKVAGVRPVVVDWCERGRAVRPDEARRILEVLAQCMSDVHTPTTFVEWEGEQR